MGNHQDLMDAAYKKWRKDGGWLKGKMIPYGQFLLELDVKERRAVVLGNLNYQVENGGFFQWRDNGYDEGIKFLREALMAVNTDLSKAVLTLVDAAMRVDMSNQYDEGELFDISDTLGKLDTVYYAINDAFMAECEKFFAKE